jgi:hypothetical protein
MIRLKTWSRESHDTVPLNCGFLGMRRRRQKTYPKRKKRRKKMTHKDAEEYYAVDDAGDDACMVDEKLPKKPRLTIFSFQIYALCLIFLFSTV